MVVLPLPFPKNYQQLIFSLCGWLEKRIESGCSCRAAKFVRIFLPSADCDFLGAPLFVLFTKPGLRRLLFVVYHTTFCDDDDEYSFCLPSLLLLLLCRFCCDELDGLANTLARTHSHSLTDHTFHSAAMLFLFFFSSAAAIFGQANIPCSDESVRLPALRTETVAWLRGTKRVKTTIVSGSG